MPLFVFLAVGLVLGWRQPAIAMPVVAALSIFAVYEPGEIGAFLTRTAAKIKARPRDNRLWNTMAPAFLPPLFGVCAAGGFPSLGNGLDTQFYAVTAEVIPVIYLAGVVQMVGLVGRQAPKDDRAVVRLLVAGFSLGALEGEVFALYAVGAAISTTFLLVATATAGLVLCFLLSYIFYSTI